MFSSPRIERRPNMSERKEIHPCLCLEQWGFFHARGSGQFASLPLLCPWDADCTRIICYKKTRSALLLTKRSTGKLRACSIIMLRAMARLKDQQHAHLGELSDCAESLAL